MKGIGLGILPQLLPLLVTFLLQEFDIEKEGYLPHVQIAYMLVQAALLASWAFVYWKVCVMPDDGAKIKVPAVRQMGIEVKPAMVQSAYEYDMSKLKEQVHQVLVSCFIVGCVHYRWGYVLPLALQMLMTPIHVLQSPLAQIHLLGRKAVGELKRPFPQPNPFGLMSMETFKEAKKKAKQAASSATNLKQSPQKKGKGK